MKEYLKGTLSECIERAKKVKENIPNETLDPYFYPLIQKCDSLIDSCIRELTESTDLLERDGFESIVLDRLKVSVSLIDRIEYGPLVTLTRKHQDDEILNSLVDKIRREIKYPINPPLACCLSNDYFYVDPFFNIMYLPTLETNFLLHIPDVYHELAHPLLDTSNNPKVEPFKKALGNVNYSLIKHFEGQIVSEARKGNKLIIESLRNWKENWVRSWSVEVFCDLFAVFMIGPAFVWSHLHLCAKRGGDPFHVPFYNLVDHPADNARMKAMLLALTLLGFKDEVKKISDKWNRFLQISDIEQTPEFERAYPESIIEQAVNYAHEAATNMKCRVVNNQTTDPIYVLLNTAWNKFWNDQPNYLDWEKIQIVNLRSMTA